MGANVQAVVPNGFDLRFGEVLDRTNREVTEHNHLQTCNIVGGIVAIPVGVAIIIACVAALILAPEVVAPLLILIILVGFYTAVAGVAILDSIINVSNRTPDAKEKFHRTAYRNEVNSIILELVPRENLRDSICGSSEIGLQRFNEKFQVLISTLRTEIDAINFFKKNAYVRQIEECERTSNNSDLPKEVRSTARASKKRLEQDRAKMQSECDKVVRLLQTSTDGKTTFTGEEDGRDIAHNLAALLISLRPKIVRSRMGADGQMSSNELGIGDDRAAEIRKKITELIPNVANRVLAIKVAPTIYIKEVKEIKSDDSADGIELEPIRAQESTADSSGAERSLVSS
ncbi:MAG: hypothetical protein LBB14_00565 [Puniceicoccales bacterium]|jgi:hypothetical protein|nr:hypothetical protein [Puniceicoccales bacterium]